MLGDAVKPVPYGLELVDDLLERVGRAKHQDDEPDTLQSWVPVFTKVRNTAIA